MTDELLPGHIVDETLENIEVNNEYVKARLAKSLKEGLNNGESIAMLQKRILCLLDIDSDEARRIAHTIAYDIYNRVDIQVYKKMGVKAVEYFAEPDLCSCDICKALDGCRWPIDSDSIIIPPLHPGCRCILLPWMNTTLVQRNIQIDSIKNYRNIKTKCYPSIIINNIHVELKQ